MAPASGLHVGRRVGRDASSVDAVRRWLQGRLRGKTDRLEGDAFGEALAAGLPTSPAMVSGPATSKTPSTGREDRRAGALVGLAAGDRNGGPVRMAVRLAESLGDLGRFEPADVLDRYLAWFRDGAFDTGPVTGRVLDLVDGGVDPVEAVRAADLEFEGMTAGCNPAHRVAPLALAGFVPTAGLAGAARREAALTHAHPLAGDTAAAVALVIRGLVEGDPLEAAVERAAGGRLPEVARTLAGADPPSPGGFAPEALGAALHFVRVADGFGEALAAGLRFAGPANYCPVLVGAIGGARWGRSSIDASQLEHCTILHRVEAATAGLG